MLMIAREKPAKAGTNQSVGPSRKTAGLLTLRANRVNAAQVLLHILLVHMELMHDAMHDRRQDDTHHADKDYATEERVD